MLDDIYFNTVIEAIVKSRKTCFVYQGKQYDIMEYSKHNGSYSFKLYFKDKLAGTLNCMPLKGVFLNLRDVSDYYRFYEIAKCLTSYKIHI